MRNFAVRFVLDETVHVAVAGVIPHTLRVEFQRIDVTSALPVLLVCHVMWGVRK